MEDHPANTSSNKDNKDAPPNNSLASQECQIQITQDPHKNGEYFDGRHIRRVPEHLRSNNQNKEDYYIPKFILLGPYHHGAPQLSKAESFKPTALQILISGSEVTREILYSEIFSVIDQVRKCYVGLPEGENEIDDNLLTEIMLLDSCFFIYLMKMILGQEPQGHELRMQFLRHLGISAVSYIYQDLYLLENQIPLWVIKILLGLIYNEEEGSMLLCNFLSSGTFGDCRLKSLPGQPLHFLDASRMLILPESSDIFENPKEGQTKCLQQLCGWKKGPTEFGKHNRQFRSVTDLKAKGIFFRPSSCCLKDIKFESYGVFAVLRLPLLSFGTKSKSYFLNVIAYESSYESVIGVETICYLNFLKSLILKPQDVRELREKKILFSSLESDEQVLQGIKEIDTFGLNVSPMFDNVRDRIEEHCDSKARTWIAEFFNTYFRSPWAFIALVAITLQLCLSVVQTYYAIHPAS